MPACDVRRGGELVWYVLKSKPPTRDGSRLSEALTGGTRAVRAALASGAAGCLPGACDEEEQASTAQLVLRAGGWSPGCVAWSAVLAFGGLLGWSRALIRR